MEIKNLIRNILNLLHLDLTKNLEYDRLTKKIMQRVLKKDSNCIDVGCHKGEILEYIIRLSPQGKHYAFEPIPELFSYLADQFSDRASVFPYALADKSGQTTFQYVRNAPAYSGIRKRKYDVAVPDIQEISVELRSLDEVIPRGTKIDLIKIDVEGGEFNVLKGAKQLLKLNKPVIIFECGLGGSDYYHTTPQDLYHFLVQEVGLHISSLKSFIQNKTFLTQDQFVHYFNTNKEYYFIAHP